MGFSLKAELTAVSVCGWARGHGIHVHGLCRDLAASAPSELLLRRRLGVPGACW